MKRLLMGLVLGFGLVGSVNAVTSFEFENGTRAKIEVYAESASGKNQISLDPSASGKFELLSDTIDLLAVQPSGTSMQSGLDGRDTVYIYTTKRGGCGYMGCRYSQPELKGKKKFKITDGTKNPGNYIVQALD